MIRRSVNLDLASRKAYDAIIDVRSPAEFAVDHVPGAINLPVLDNAERIEIGTLYVQTSKFLARRLGAAKVARAIAHHLDTALVEREAGFKPLVYCWRGGQRSGAMAAVMDQIGWPVTVLEGGYRTWRRLIVSRLYDPSPDAALPRIVLLDGRTGSGKTEVLAALATLGAQTVDLEDLAAHRGSLFGATPAQQPSQKQFESQLFVSLERLDPARPVFVEAESSRIGNITLPTMLWSAMQKAVRITLTASLSDRTRHILAVYGGIAADKVALDTALTRLPRHHSRETITRWRNLATDHKLEPLIAELMQAHYDPAYDRYAAYHASRSLGEVVVALTPAGIATAASNVAALAGDQALSQKAKMAG